jgi:uncharacterized membrane protein YuzA (DUF378 family)
MKKLDVLVIILLIIGGLNWGIIGLTGFNVIGAIFSQMPALTRIVYVIVGLCAIYQIFQWNCIHKRCKK